MLFPMYVVQVAAFMAMTEAPPHQLLKEEGVAIEFVAAQVAVFVSHQWCSRMHADPHFAQLRILQAAFKSASCRTLKVSADIFNTVVFSSKAHVRPADLRDVMSWVMWYDYFSVPQPDAPQAESSQHADTASDLGRAVASLSSYIDRCKFFFVLAPIVAHDGGHFLDYTTWKTRGWCRFERLARQLSSESGPMLLVARPDAVFEIGAQDYLMEPVGRGGFSVEADKATLSPTVQRLLASKLRRLLAARSYEDSRHLTSWCSALLDGLHRASWEAVVLARGAGPAPDAGRGCPLLVPAGLGDAAALARRLDAGAGVREAAWKDRPEFFYQAGQQPIHVAAHRGHAAAIAVLLERRAEVDARDRRAQTPLSLAAAAGSAAAALLLLERGARVEARLGVGSTALDMASIFGRTEVVELLLARRAGIEANADGVNPLHFAVLFRCGAEVARSLVLARAGLEEQMRPRVGGVIWGLNTTWNLAYRCGGRSLVCLVGHHSWGATPLLLALMFDNCAEARVLLEAGSPVGMRNDQGADARAIAEIFHTSEALRPWLDGAAAPATP